MKKKKIINIVKTTAIGLSIGAAVTAAGINQKKISDSDESIKNYINSDIATLQSVRRSLELQKYNRSILQSINDDAIASNYDVVGAKHNFKNYKYVEVGLEDKESSVIYEGLVDINSGLEVIPADKYQSIGDLYVDSNNSKIYADCYNQIEGQVYPALVDITNMKELVSCEDKMNLEKVNNNDTDDVTLKYSNVKEGHYNTLTLKKIR